MKRILISAMLLTAVLHAAALIPTQQRQRLATGWQFLRGDLGNVWEAVRQANAGKPESVPLWQNVTLPHCYNAEDAVAPDVNYYQGPAWYRTTLDVNNPYHQGRTYLEFEGAGQKTQVYVYTTLVATHTGGYDQWKADITDAVERFVRTETCRRQFHGRIPIAVRCDNSRDTQFIPSDMSDFNLYGGIYRHLNLVYVPQVSLERVKIDATPQSGHRGTVDVRVDTRAPQGSRAKITVKILDPDGRELYTSPAKAVSDASPRVQICDISVRGMQRWSPLTPRLYTCEVTLISGIDTMVDRQHFGFRSFEFVDKGPFLLNGQRLLLRGTHRHEDHAGVGAALTDEMTLREMRQIKAMGANFIRLGHYQQSDRVLQLCDSLGLMVWEEIPWCRGGLGAEAYQQQARDMLRNMIDQHYNHPSIILWGLGNENDWPGDFPTFSQDSIRQMMTTLNKIAHQLDPVRKTCIRRCDFARDLVDVYSPSIWAGWYKNRYTDYTAMTREAFDTNTHFLHAEWGGDSHAGRHAEDCQEPISNGDRNGDWSETYIVKLFDWHLHEQQHMPWLTGSAFWTFKDFSTPLRPDNPIPYVNQKGVVERDGTPKESYYVFQSYWATEPMVHIYGHSWPVRWGAPRQAREVLVYANCPTVELFLNGRSQGIRHRNIDKFPASGLSWQCVFDEGPNIVVAVSRHQGRIIADTLHLSYQSGSWGKPHALKLSLTTTAEGDSMAETVLIDSIGRICLDANQVVEFGSTLPGLLLTCQGTTRGSRVIQLANGRAHIRLLPQGRAAVVSVRLRDSDSVPPAFLHVDL